MTFNSQQKTYNLRQQFTKYLKKSLFVLFYAKKETTVQFHSMIL